MSVELKETNGGKLLEVHLTGNLVKENYGAFVPAVERLVKQHGKINMLAVMHDSHGWTAGALWEDTKFALHHFRDIERLAVVGEAKWEKDMAAFCKPFTAAIVRYFDHTQAAEARDWLAGRNRNTPAHKDGKPKAQPDPKPPDREIAALIVDLGSNSEVARKRAESQLRRIGQAAIGPLLQALATSTEYGRGRAARTLGEIGDPAAAPALVKALEDDKFDVRWLAARAVMTLGQAGLAALLQALIERPHSTLLRESAHHVLHDEAHEKWSRQLAPVMQTLEGPDPEAALPMAATNALKAIRSRPTRPTMSAAGESR
ncbi:MAG: STAS/SEC14 domain-containing protein [Verrucomicrobiia bacterium]